MKLARRRFLHLAAGAAVASFAVTTTEASGGKIRVGFINPTGSPNSGSLCRPQCERRLSSSGST